jgi:hypothetical protein
MAEKHGDIPPASIPAGSEGPVPRTRGRRLYLWCIFDMLVIMGTYTAVDIWLARSTGLYSRFIIAGLFAVGMGLVAGWLMNGVVRRREAVEKARLAAMGQLDAARSEIRKLSNLLPICANCKKIRDEFGRWHEVASYISSHSDTRFTHGVCEECARTLYPDIVNKTGTADRVGESP